MSLFHFFAGLCVPFAIGDNTVLAVESVEDVFNLFKRLFLSVEKSEIVCHDVCVVGNLKFKEVYSR